MNDTFAVMYNVLYNPKFDIWSQSDKQLIALFSRLRGDTVDVLLLIMNNGPRRQT